MNWMHEATAKSNLTINSNTIIVVTTGGIYDILLLCLFEVGFAEALLLPWMELVLAPPATFRPGGLFRANNGF